MSYHSQSKKQDWNERRAWVKNKARFDDVVVALDLIADGAPHGDCPHCKACASLHGCHAGQGYYCDVCEETGDMIKLAQATRNCDFRRAIEALEEVTASGGDKRTGDLFGGGA